MIIIFALFTPFLSHLFLTRIRPSFRETAKRQQAVYISFLAGWAVLTVIFLIWSVTGKAKPIGGLCWSAVYLFLAYILSGYIYFQLFNLGETGRRVHILQELHNQGLEEGELKRRYACRQIISNRLGRLVNVRHLQLMEGRYIIRNKTLLSSARITSGLRNILFSKKAPQPRLFLFIALVLIISAILNHCAFFLKTLLYPQHYLFLAVFVALAAVFSLRFLKEDGRLSNFLIVCIPYLLSVGRYLLLPVTPPADSGAFFFPVFRYMAKAMASGYFLPGWLADSGGIRAGFFHMSLFLVSPFRIIASYFYSLIPIEASAVFLYKLQYIAAVIFLAFGWWLVLKIITSSQYAVYFGTLMVMMGGTGITFHQEQVLSTTYLMPWLILSFLKIRDDPSYIWPITLIFGLGLSLHQPQIQLISMGLVIVLSALLYPRKAFEIVRKQKRHALILAVLLLLAALPAFYIFCNMKNLTSPERAMGENIFPKAYAEYIKGGSYALPAYFSQYLNPRYVAAAENELTVDACSFFVGRLGLLLALLAAAFNLRKTLPAVFLLTCFIFLALGAYAPLPLMKFLYLAHFPFIGLFQQWFHFFPMINFCLSFLAALGLAGLIKYLERPKPKAIFNLAVFALFFLQIFDLALFDRNYLSLVGVETAIKADAPIDRFFFFSRNAEGPTQVMQYKNRYRLQESCPEAIPAVSFLSGNLLSVTEAEAAELKETCNLQSQGRGTTVINTPLSVLNNYIQKNWPDNIPVDTFIGYEGLSFNLDVPGGMFLVTPLNYDLGVLAYVDGKEAQAWRAQSALSAVFLEKGRHKVNLTVKPDAWQYIALIQLMFYIYLCLFFIYKYIREQGLNA